VLTYLHALFFLLFLPFASLPRLTLTAFLSWATTFTGDEHPPGMLSPSFSSFDVEEARKQPLLLNLQVAPVETQQSSTQSCRLEETIQTFPATMLRSARILLVQRQQAASILSPRRR
jgi:hypothetical protein